MNRWALPIGLISVILLAFQNCAPPAPSGEQGDASSCTQPTLREFKTASRHVQISVSRSELHHVSDSIVLQLPIAGLSVQHGVIRDPQAESESYLVIADQSLVTVDVRPNALVERSRLKLDRNLCDQPLKSHEDGSVQVGGYLITDGQAHYIGCDASLSTSSCYSNSGNSGFGSRSGDGRGDEYATVGSQEPGGATGSSAGGSSTVSDSLGGGGETSSGEVGGSIGADNNCYGMKNGQTAWETYDTKMYEDPSCRGYRVRFIEVIYEREVRCEDGNRVPTGKKRESEKKNGSC